MSTATVIVVWYIVVLIYFFPLNCFTGRLPALDLMLFSAASSGVLISNVAQLRDT